MQKHKPLHPLRPWALSHSRLSLPLETLSLETHCLPHGKHRTEREVTTIRFFCEEKIGGGGAITQRKEQASQRKPTASHRVRGKTASERPTCRRRKSPRKMRFFAFAAAAAAASLLGAEVSAFDESLCAPACAGTTSNVGNGKCNLVNNNCGCSWDGGDCCGTSGNANQYSACGVDKTAGSEAECCIDPNYAPLTGPPRTSPSTTGRPTIASTTRPQSSSTTRPRSTTQTRPDLGAPAPGRPDAVPSPAPGRPDAVPAPRGGTLPPRTTAEVTRPRISSTSTTSPPRGGGGGVTRQSTTRGGAPRRTTLVETRPPVESTTSTLPPRGGNGDPTRGQTSEPTRPDFTTTARKSNTITGASTRRSTTTTSTAANAPTTTTKTTTAGGPFDEANCKPQCTGNIANLGNRKCNNVNNNCACDWDHGDCCGSTGLSTQYSSCGGTEEACCLDPKFGAPVTTTIHSVPTTTTTKAPPTTTKAAQVTTTT